MSPITDQDFDDWIKADVIVSLVPDTVDVKFATGLAIAIMLDKPIIAVVRPEMTMPAKLARVVDQVVEWSGPADHILMQRLQDAAVNLKLDEVENEHIQ